MGVSRGTPPNKQGYRFNPSPERLSMPLPADVAMGAAAALQDYAHETALPPRQQAFKKWADQIINSSTSDFIRHPNPDDKQPCREISVHLDPPPTQGLDFDLQRNLIESLKGVPANPIEQLLAALVLKCRCPEKSPFTGIIRNSERGKGLLDTDLSGLRVVLVSEEKGPIYFMSMSIPVAGTRAV